MTFVYWLLVFNCIFLHQLNSQEIRLFTDHNLIFDASNPLFLQGKFSGHLELIVTEEYSCLGTPETAIFEASVDLTDPASLVNIKVFGRGDYPLEIYHPHLGWQKVFTKGSTKFGWRKLLWKNPYKIGSLRYRVKLLGQTDLFCKMLGPSIRALDSDWSFEPVDHEIIATPGVWKGLIGVNLEASYLFTELDREERRKLLLQAKQDGFNSIRLHKLTRLMQQLDFNYLFKPTFQKFLDDLEEFKFTLNLDILSWPLKTNLDTTGFVDDGWKQWIFLSPELQERTMRVLEWLHKLKFYGQSFFKSSGLIGILLFNENSLFFEYPQALLNGHVQPCETMLNTAKRFEFSIRNLGFKGPIVMSNYQSGGKDRDCNLRFSKVLDRHLYFDYPYFYKNQAKVGGRSPLEFLHYWKEQFRELFHGAQTIWISEINLPWPNQFMHELLPTILVLDKERSINGIWFYDYRLRSTNFHEGGLFGIQRFRSVIEPLGWFKRLLEDDKEIHYSQHVLKILSPEINLRCVLRGHPTERIPHCKWTRGNKLIYTGPERAFGDAFDMQFLRQIDFGSQAMKIKL